MLVRRSLLAASVIGLTFASACTTASQGEPRPATTAETAPPTSSSGAPGDNEELPFAGAPKVDNPLDTSRYEQDPCQSLTSDQVQPLNLPPTGETMDNVALGKGCEWFNPDTRGEVNIVFVVGDPRGLSPEYEVNNRHGWKYFDELPDIEGYPAVARSGTDDRDIGRCTVVTGVADDMSFETVLRLSQDNIGQKDPCEVAVQVAGLALQTMKQGA